MLEASFRVGNMGVPEEVSSIDVSPDAPSASIRANGIYISVI